MITDIVSGFFQGVVKPVLDKWVPDAQARLEAEQMFFKLAHEVNLGQIEVNKTEAASSSTFVAGWRPFIGWVCGASLAYAMIGYSFLTWLFQVASLYSGHTVPAPPVPDTTVAFELLMGMLGLGGLRTYEKLKGVHAR